MNLSGEHLDDAKEVTTSNTLGLIDKTNEDGNANFKSSNEASQDSSPEFDVNYPGHVKDETPEPEGGYKPVGMEFPNPYMLVCFFDPDIADGHTTLYPWQMEINELLGTVKPDQQNPFKFCLLASNGSGKDKFIIAPFVVWFMLTKVRSRTIVTTSSGTQLTSQTEPYIKDLCEKVNSFFGYEVFRIRQRYIKCMLTGSEVRLFATDEKGKAEGYHPIDSKSEMAIIVNEWKSVKEEITEALKRCTGFNYWLGVSSAGEPKGALYKAYTKPTMGYTVRRITTYDCPHQSQSELQCDKEDYTESSAYFRSKHLSLFTSLSTLSVISMELVNNLIENPPLFTIDSWPVRVGIDLAAGGDENAICILNGNRITKEYYFRSVDTTQTARRIAKILEDEKISKTHTHIYADDGGVGKAILDMLAGDMLPCFGYNINRILNQSPALGDSKRFGNRGAENWWRVYRILEEKFVDLRGISQLTQEQLYTRNYKQSALGQKIYLESKKEAKSHGRLSPDRADAFILAFTGLTYQDFKNAVSDGKVSFKTRHDQTTDKRPRVLLQNPQAVAEYYENKVTFAEYGEVQNKATKFIKPRIYNSLKKAMQ